MYFFQAKLSPRPPPPNPLSQVNMASNTTIGIIERLKTIASLTTKLKIAYYDKRLLPTWNGIYQKLKVCSEGLEQEVKKNPCTDLSAKHICGCLKIIESHTAELKRRIPAGRGHRRKKKNADQLKSKSFNSICKSIMQNINNTIEELQKNESIVIDSLANHFEVSLDLESSESCLSSDDSLVVSQDNEKFQEEYDELVPIECINENQVLEL